MELGIFLLGDAMRIAQGSRARAAAASAGGRPKPGVRNTGKEELQELGRVIAESRERLEGGMDEVKDVGVPGRRIGESSSDCVTRAGAVCSRDIGVLAKRRRWASSSLHEILGLSDMQNRVSGTYLFIRSSNWTPSSTTATTSRIPSFILARVSVSGEWWMPCAARTAASPICRSAVTAASLRLGGESWSRKAYMSEASKKYNAGVPRKSLWKVLRLVKQCMTKKS